MEDVVDHRFDLHALIVRVRVKLQNSSILLISVIKNS
jgi:hypothetical protein